MHESISSNAAFTKPVALLSSPAHRHAPSWILSTRVLDNGVSHVLIIYRHHLFLPQGPVGSQ